MRVFREGLVVILDAAPKAVFGSFVPEEMAALAGLIRFGVFRGAPGQLFALIRSPKTGLGTSRRAPDQPDGE
jgi:hypothetical protein